MAKLTLSGTPSFVKSDRWQRFSSSVNDHLPIRNLHWKSAARPSIRTIQQLNAATIPFDSQQLDAQTTWLIFENPLLNIYAVLCDVSSL